MNWIDHSFEASLYGVGRGILGLPFEHPIDVAKTTWQVNPQLPSEKSVIQTIYNNRGFKGFYAGWLPAGVKSVSKQLYRWPMMIVLPQYFPGRRKNVSQITLAASIATFEVGCINPFERIKVWRVTQGNKALFKASMSSCLREAYQGGLHFWSRQFVGWTSFLLSDYNLKKWERERLKIQGPLPISSLAWITLIVGSINTAVTMPFDTLKTRLQSSFRDKRFRGLYSGWRFQLLYYMVQSAFSVYFLDRLECKSRNSEDTTSQLSN